MCEVSYGIFNLIFLPNSLWACSVVHNLLTSDSKANERFMQLQSSFQFTCVKCHLTTREESEAPTVICYVFKGTQNYVYI